MIFSCYVDICSSGAQVAGGCRGIALYALDDQLHLKINDGSYTWEAAYNTTVSNVDQAFTNKLCQNELYWDIMEFSDFFQCVVNIFRS